MEESKNNVTDHRDKLSRHIIIGSLIIIGMISVVPIVTFLKNGNEEGLDDLFNVIIPLLATWIGTILAFYFGRENFEAASKQYRSIINQLTPDLLDDIHVEQIMIEKATMVFMDFSNIQNLEISKIIDFMSSVNKSRLPILQNEQPKFVIHKSVFLEALNKHGSQVPPLDFNTFIQNNNQIATSFIEVSGNETLEAVLEKMKAHPLVQDVFITENGKLIGWLPDSLINRYLRKN